MTLSRSNLYAKILSLVKFKMMKSADQIAAEIMSIFVKANSKPEHTINGRAVQSYVRTQLNPKEQNLVDSAFEILLDLNYIAIKNIRGADTYVLTQPGYEYIYPIDRDEVINEISERILDEFRRNNSRVNEFIPMRWVQFNLMPSLNPREQELVIAALESLDSSGYITGKETPMSGIVLTQPGFDYIFQ